MERANPKLYLTKNDQVRPHWPHSSSTIFATSEERPPGAVFAACPRRRACRRALTWAELERTDPKQFAAANFDEWKARLKRDPWLRMKDVKQQLSDRAIAAVAEVAGTRST